MSVADELRSWLHPAHPRQTPTPGFPTGRAFVAWVQDQPREEVVEALLETLRSDAWAQQYAAMAALRALGLGVHGVGYQPDFVWEVTDDSGATQIIRPQVQT